MYTRGGGRMNPMKKIPDCPVEMTLQLIGDKWKVLIIRDLMTGTKRFNELMRSVTGDHTESADQSSAQHGGKRPAYQESISRSPPKVEYTLTETGYSLKPILDSMVDWGTNYKNNLE